MTESRVRITGNLIQLHCSLIVALLLSTIRQIDDCRALGIRKVDGFWAIVKSRATSKSHSDGTGRITTNVDVYNFILDSESRSMK